MNNFLLGMAITGVILGGGSLAFGSSILVTAEYDKIDQCMADHQWKTRRQCARELRIKQSEGIARLFSMDL